MNVYHISNICLCRVFQVTQIQDASQHFIETEREKRSRATRARSMGDAEERLVVTIIEGADLQASDPNGGSDPYCEASMGSQEHRTKVIPNNLNPKWNSTVRSFPAVLCPHKVGSSRAICPSHNPEMCGKVTSSPLN